jgi:hypothetical protein
MPTLVEPWERLSQPLALLADRAIDRRLWQRRQPVEHPKPRRDEGIEQAIPCFAYHRRLTRLQFGMPDGSRWRRLQRLDRPPDPRPYELPLVIVSVQHQVLKAGGFKLGIVAVLSD